MLTHWSYVFPALTHRTADALPSFITYAAQSHNLNQGWLIIKWTQRKNFQWNFKPNTNIFIQENAFQNSVCRMLAAILFQPHCEEEETQHELMWFHSAMCNFQFVLAGNSMISKPNIFDHCLWRFDPGIGIIKPHINVVICNFRVNKYTIHNLPSHIKLSRYILKGTLRMPGKFQNDLTALFH